MGAILGVLFHAIGGFAAGSFYIPFKFIKKWSWESSWLVLGIAAWMLTPMLMAYLTVPDLGEVLMAADRTTKFYTFLFGMLWGIGGLTFGLSMRYLGISLGMAVALGFCAAFGTLIPPIYQGKMGELMGDTGGQIVLLGVLLCLVGIGIVGKAGVYKEEELDDEQQKAAVEEFNLSKGLTVAVISGILSACFAFGLQAGKPIAEQALAHGVQNIFQNNAVLIWILWGGFLTNFIWTVWLNFKNKSYTDYTNEDTPKNKNFFWAAVGGVTWYFQFFFYGMGETYLGEDFGFASWTLHMAFIILFSSIWGVYFKEWAGVSKRTNRTLILGLVVIVLSTALVGAGNFYKI